MDIIEQAKIVAAARWGETGNEPQPPATENPAEVITKKSLEANPGWELATVYSYRCYEDYHAYCVVLWKSRGESNGFAQVGLRICLYEKDDAGNFILKNVERME
jgi:hypothetical protein